MKKIFTIFAALTLSAGLWAEGSVFTYTATEKLESQFAGLGTVASQPDDKEYICNMIWSGDVAISWSPSVSMGALSWGGYDWSTVNSGDKLTVYFEKTEGAEYTNLRFGNGSWAALPTTVADPASAEDGTYGGLDEKTSMSIILSQADIDALVNEGGLVICGNGLTIKGVEVCFPKPASAYYLVGYINGANYGISDDIDNMGDYNLTAGPVVITFTEKSYVQVKNQNKSIYGTAYVDAIEPGSTVLSVDATDKIGLPANVEITFTLTENADGTVTLAYTWGDTEYKYTEYENWQIKYGNTWEWSGNMEKVEDGLFKLEVLWEGTGINVKSDENPIKKDWFALEELVLGEEVIAPVTVDVYLKVIDDETVMIGVGVIPSTAPVVGDQFVDETSGLKFEVTAVGEANTVMVIVNNYTDTTYTIPATVKYNDVDFAVTEIGENAFFGWSSLQSVTLSEGLITIGELAFGMTGLTSITIPAGVTTIGLGAFYQCAGLTSVTFLGNACQDAIGDMAFYGVGDPDPALLTLHGTWAKENLPDEDGNWYDGKFELSEDPSALPTLFDDGVKANKFFHNGQLIIRKGNKYFNALGAEVK